MNPWRNWSRLDITKQQLDTARDRIADLENELLDLRTERDALESELYDLQQENEA